MRRCLLAVIGLLVVTCAEASGATAEGVFKEWLTAYNANDAVALGAFNQRRFGDPDIRFALDSREEPAGSMSSRSSATLFNLHFHLAPPEQP